MAMPTPLSFGALLKHQRRYVARMTQEELADGSGYSVSYISMLERGERTPQSSTVEMLAVGLRLDDADRAALLAAYARASVGAPPDATPGAIPGARGGAPAVAASAASDAGDAPDLRDGVALRTILRVGLRGPKPVPDVSAGPAAAAYVARFGALVESAVAAYGGLIEAMENASAAVSFVSARQALRAAVALHARCLEERSHDASWPWQAGIGLHASAEPPIDRGARAMALIAAPGAAPDAPIDDQPADEQEGAPLLAQRLCDLAGPGEILASDMVMTLAPAEDGLVSSERGRLQSTGVGGAPRVHQITYPMADALARTDPHFAPAAPTPLPLGGYLGALPEGPLVARVRELARLRPALESALSGAGQLVLLSGEPGVGKTRLAQELTREARNCGMLVAVGRCYLPQQAVAYYPFLEALAMLYAGAPAAVREQVPDRWLELSRLLPELAASAGALVNLASAEDQQRLLWQVTGFIQAVAEAQPVALLLDDLQWADQASLDLLLHLARQTRGAPVLLVCLHRDSELPPQAPLQVALRELAHERLAERMPISLLAEDGTAALMAACLGLGEVTSEFAALVHEPTAGNAFFVQEVIRTLIERGDLYWQDGRWHRRAIDEIAVPESVRATIGERVGRLAAATQTLLRAASVLGQTFSFDDVWHMQETDGQTTPDDMAVEAALAEAATAGLVRETGDEAYRFSHALTRRALAAELSPRQRRRLHLAAGLAIERLPEHARTRRTAELARHFLAGDAPERALPHLLSAGEQSEAVYAHAEAERFYRTALEVARTLGDRARDAEAAEKLAGVVASLARGDEELVLLQQALAAYQELDDLEGQRRTGALVADTFNWRIDPRGTAAGWELLAPLLRTAHSALSTPGMLELHQTASRLHTTDGDLAAAVEEARMMLAVATDLGDRHLLARAQLELAGTLRTVGRDDEALRVLQGALGSLEGVGDLRSLAIVLTWIADLLSHQGNLADCEQILVRACETAAQLARPGTMIHTQSCLGQWAFWVGDWARAQQCVRQLQELCQRPELDESLRPFWYAHTHAMLGPLALAQGTADGMAALEEAVTLVASLPGTGPEKVDSLRIGHGALAERELLLGNALAAQGRLAALSDAIRDHAGAVAALQPLLAWGAIQQGDLTMATELLEHSLRYLRNERLFFALVDALRIWALLAIQQRKWSSAEEMLDEAITRAHAMPYPYAEAKALYVKGLLYQAQNQSQRSRDAFSASLVILDRFGEHLYADQIERVFMTPPATESSPD